MQIDFHHATTYTVARLAGFTDQQASIIAYASQFVDDNIGTETVCFLNGCQFAPYATAHRALDYNNLKSLSASLVWMPFHFLPGNGGLPVGDEPEGEFVHKLVTYPNSHPAQDMFRACIAAKDQPWSLHRLGITAHTYVDTWAHQGFAGIAHAVNNVSALEAHSEAEEANLSLIEQAKEKLDRLTSIAVETTSGLGHGSALSLPDMPFLRWQYKDHEDNLVIRDNPKEYMAAVENLHLWFGRYLAGDPNSNTESMGARDLVAIEQLIVSTIEKDGGLRHGVWREAIASGAFSFGPAEICYPIDEDKEAKVSETGHGDEGWRKIALGTSVENEEREFYTFMPQFLTSDWRYFQLATRDHRFDLSAIILPRYGISAS